MGVEPTNSVALFLMPLVGRTNAVPVVRATSVSTAATVYTRAAVLCGSLAWVTSSQLFPI